MRLIPFPFESVIRRPCISSKMKRTYAMALCLDDATLDDLREAVTTVEKTERTARRVLGGTHPLVALMQVDLRDARATLRAREETQPSPG